MAGFLPGPALVVPVDAVGDSDDDIAPAVLPPPPVVPPGGDQHTPQEESAGQRQRVYAEVAASCCYLHPRQGCVVQRGRAPLSPSEETAN